MSRASIQSLTILSVVFGSIITIEEENLSGDAAPIISYLRGMMREKVCGCPETGTRKKNDKLLTENCNALYAELESSKNLYTACCLGMLSQFLLIELRDKVRDRVKINIIDELLECINAAVDIYDPKERNEESRAEAERLVGVVKRHIGMT